MDYFKLTVMLHVQWKLSIVVVHVQVNSFMRLRLRSLHSYFTSGAPSPRRDVMAIDIADITYTWSSSI
jgi:hypothetical protein